MTALLLLAPTALAQTVKAAPPAAGTSPTTPMPMDPAKINVNTASAEELLKIPGVSTKIAQLIIKNRPYKNADELVKKLRASAIRMSRRCCRYWRSKARFSAAARASIQP
ncbi:ComEA family DNA-binding protein [Deinococcus irradiatisoli]|uniref:ComEA family DNA-binding protein n=1 Tax=Deinococcus irradiatisoli TaxID=2202254 RepID=UPI0015E8466A|nr:helix-hairpin-helix domain-containing protein [Deinococcus irradiatisoli]